jgi:hypothetical protein
MFVVQANSGKLQSFRFEKTTRKDALMVAIHLVAQGMAGVSITDEQGRVWCSGEFQSFFEQEPSAQPLNGRPPVPSQPSVGAEPDLSAPAVGCAYATT